MKKAKFEIELGRFLVPCRMYGNAEQIIICISGAKQTMASWRSFISHFVADYSIVVFDMPGQGRSLILEGSQGVTFDEQVQVLHAVISKVSPNKAVIIAAASWGTIIGAAYAARYPDRVDKMILGSFGAKPTQAILDVIREGQQLFKDNQTSKIALLMIERFGQNISESHKSQIINQFQKMSWEQYKSFYEHCEFVSKTKDIDNYIDLRKIKASTLIVSGEYDPILDKDDIKEASSHIPNCEYKMIRNAGHFLHWEREEILHTYSEFLSRV